ncbi:MAG: GDSL-like Lipase/Acylhydrolase family protein [Bacteriophage sp.]|nr:MAG: GDSL-like Lipase/Acylhydrolase family protein [Bacteriophage sp.]
MAEKPTIPDFPTLPDFGKMITQACEVVASVRGIPYDFNGTLSLENKFVVLFKTVKEMFDAQDNLVKSYKALYDFVNQYFTNLDLQTEVNKKIEEMKDSGELLNLLKPTVSNEVSTWLTSNITNPSNPPIDKSLTIENAAADSKVVGERLLKDGLSYSKQFSDSAYYKGSAISSRTDVNGTSYISFDNYNKAEAGTDTHLIGVTSRFTIPIDNPKTDTLDVYYLVDARDSGINGQYSLSLWLSSGVDWNNANVCYGGTINFKNGKISLNKMTLRKGGSSSDVIKSAVVRIDNTLLVPNTVNIKFMLFTDSTLYYLWDAVNSNEYTTDLCFWGDSLTAGAGGSGTSYPNVCASELGITSFKNCGVGGENANTIACRQGGDSLILKPGNVSEYSLSELKDIYGTQCNPLRQGSGSNSVNPIYINGVKCTLSISQTSTTDPNAKYTITGYNDKLLAETPVKFAGCDIKSKITVIFVGQNGPGLAERLSIIDSMISKINDKYIVMGLSSGSTTSRSDEESQMLSKYGVHYFNTRNMLSKYGMSIMNLTPTTSDVNEMSKGEVPSSLRSDSVHLNANGYTALGKMLAQKIRACGYV